MIPLLKKEISTFFSSLIGYIVIIVFMTINGLFMWILPGNFNILDSGYSNIDSLFALAPWVFLFLVPAVTMRLFAEEKRTGTIEVLMTRPITELQIILAKFFAGLLLVVLSLIPTLIYYFSVYYLGAQTGNIDSGGTWGSYIGLLFLAAIYVAIGLFASSITDNQIIAFIVAVALCLTFYLGFDSVSALAVFKSIADFLLTLGINDHYQSISRGVLDTRDIIYFVSVISIFILLTKLRLEARKWK